MTPSTSSQTYWRDVIDGWAEGRLLPPQLDELRAVLAHWIASADELTVAHECIASLQERLALEIDQE